MPRSAKKPCRQSMCPALVDQAGYCDKHKKKTWIRKEGTTTQRGYGAKWRRTREIIIRRDNGLCQPCLRNDRVTAFNAVDHITPKSKGGTDNPDNLQCICNECHKKKTSTQDNRP